MKLKNLDHEFDLNVGDVGVTIRNGNKWQIPQGTKIQLVEQYSSNNPDVTVGDAVVIGAWTGAYKKLPASLISIEHNESARDSKVLFSMMKAGYGETFTEDSEVTALIYERTTRFVEIVPPVAS